jgi:tripartite-type tricarboxylate transporter receptor subunit TctC
MDFERKIHRIVAGVLFYLAIFGLLSVLPASTCAAEYPDRSITLVVPFAPGGVTDLGARALAEGMEKYLKKPIVVVNRPGGGTTIGGNAVATAKPDGYTLGFFTTPTSIPEIYTYFTEAPYSSKDLKPVCRIMTPVLAITVKADSPWNSVKDMVEAARKSGGLKVGTHGKSTLGYLAMRTIGKADKVTFTDVPFGGDTQIVPAILGGHIAVGTPAFPAIKALLDAKQVKVLALLLEKRADFAPNIPTVVEQGYKLSHTSYLGIFVPKGTADDIVVKLNDTVAKVAQEADFRAKVNTMGTQLHYEATAAFQKSIGQYRDTLATFFKEEGFVK